MVSWGLLWLVVSVATVGGFILGAIMCSGRMADQDQEISFWRGECIKICARYKIDLPLGPEEGE